MVTFIIICVVVFIVIVIFMNYQKILGYLKKFNKKTDNTKPKKEESKKQEASNFIYEEEDSTYKKEDTSKKDNPQVIVESFVTANEKELAELEADSKKNAGRKAGNIKSIDNIEVKVEDLEDEEELDLQEEDLFELEEMGLIDRRQSSISEQIKNLPPEIKALLISNLLARKDD